MGNIPFMKMERDMTMRILQQDPILVDIEAFSNYLKEGVEQGKVFIRQSSVECPLAQFLGRAIGVDHFGQAVTGSVLFEPWCSEFVDQVDRATPKVVPTSEWDRRYQVTAEEALAILEGIKPKYAKTGGEDTPPSTQEPNDPGSPLPDFGSTVSGRQAEDSEC